MQITDPVEHAARVGDAQDKYNDAVEASEVALERAYLALCKNGDAKALAHFAPLDQTIDYKSGPSYIDMLQVLLNAALGKFVEVDAMKLLGKMAKTYAHYNVDSSKIEE